jgi:hypothetical protein
MCPKSTVTVENLIWKGSLQPSTEEAVGAMREEWNARGITESVGDAVRDFPIVSIGQPAVWTIHEMFPLDKMPHSLRSKLDEADFYVVLFHCSFRPVRKESQVEWARFLVRLLPDDMGRQPIAFDLHPREVKREVKHDVSLTIGPSLKFQEVEAKLGGFGSDLGYSELQPIISATGVAETVPMWDYWEARGVMVSGSKDMHLLLKAPKGMKTVRAVLDLVADVRVRDTRIPALVIRDEKQAREHLTVRLV